MRVLVCLPSKDEKDSIQIMIDQIKELKYDLIISDEQSIDGTIEIAEKNNIPVYQRDGKGKGYGVRKALEVAILQGYDALLLIDCDCSYPPRHIPELLEYLPDYDMVVGKRDMKNIQLSHRIVNVLHTGILNLLFGTKLGDINSGLRVFKVDKFQNLLDTQGFDIEAQITARALKKGLKIKEIPIDYRKRTGDSKIRAWDTFTILKRIIRERLTWR